MHVSIEVSTFLETNVIRFSMGEERWVNLEFERSSENVIVKGRNGASHSWQHILAFDDLEKRLRP